jgi:hypothetical protein
MRIDFDDMARNAAIDSEALVDLSAAAAGDSIG